MLFHRLKLFIKRLSFYLEFILAVFIAASVVIGVIDLFRYIMLIFNEPPLESYDILQKFLGHTLLLVVGVELIAMLVFHSPSSVIEVMLYAVARKLLIGTQSMVDFMIGIIAIAAIFAIRKFLFVKDISNSYNNIIDISAATSVKAFNEIYGTQISESLGNTIGGVVSRLAKNSFCTIFEGAEFSLADVKIQITKLQDGVIERVALINIKK